MHILEVLSVILAVWFVFFALPWIREGHRLRTTPGYVVPKVSRAAAWFQGVVSAVACRIMIGPVKFVRSPKIDDWNGRLVAAINHQVMGDIPVLLKVGHKRTWRYMSAVEQVKLLRAWYFAWTGCVAVVRDDKEKAQLALQAAVDGMVLDREANFALFPQRRLVADNNLDPAGIRPGAVRIAHLVQQKTGEKIAILPVYIGYDERPRGLFSLPLLRNLRRVRVKMKNKDLVETAWVERKIYGATVVAGDPIAADDLPESPAEVAKLLSDRWTAMKQHCAGCERLSVDF
ncbi:MAG TPA: 1-acyl-sn-glycerol-3-phosphate acyltransferase [Planktothrix sp.]|jgi:hypothetical protein